MFMISHKAKSNRIERFTNICFHRKSISTSKAQNTGPCTWSV